eukprot:366411-Chlamydomonas_euryale.AAC.3
MAQRVLRRHSQPPPPLPFPSAVSADRWTWDFGCFVLVHHVHTVCEVSAHQAGSHVQADDEGRPDDGADDRSVAQDKGLPRRMHQDQGVRSGTSRTHQRPAHLTHPRRSQTSVTLFAQKARVYTSVTLSNKCHALEHVSCMQWNAVQAVTRRTDIMRQRTAPAGLA